MLTMTSALTRAQRVFGGKTAIIDTEATYSWAEEVDRIARLANGLGSLGIEPTHRFGIVSPNTFRYQEALYAGYWSGAVPVPINMRLAPPEIQYILENAECSWLLLGPGFENLADAPELAPWKDHLVFLGPETDAVPWPSADGLIADYEPLPPHPAREDDIALMLYTGGTTGRSKGVPLTHLNIVSNGMQVGLVMGAAVDDIYLHIPPMFHAADLLATGFTLVGSAHCFLPVFTPVDVLTAIQDYRVTSCMMAPTMIIMTLGEESFGSFDLSSLRVMLYGSSPMAAEWIKRTMEAFEGADILQGYGLTETSPILTTLDPPEHRQAIESGDLEILRSAGRPVVGVDMKILGPDGNEVSPDDSGEVVVRGPNVSHGYLNRPEETSAAFKDGWFHTGDVGRLDENGYLFVQDRKKDMVITGGENVYTTEVEAALYQHPEVHETAVIGVPDEKFGEALFAVIVPVPGSSLDEDAVIEHCRGRIGSYKIPRKMAFVEEMPKSAMGKILKAELRKTYGGSEKISAAQR